MTDGDLKAGQTSEKVETSDIQNTDSQKLNPERNATAKEVQNVPNKERFTTFSDGLPALSGSESSAPSLDSFGLVDGDTVITAKGDIRKDLKADVLLYDASDTPAGTAEETGKVTDYACDRTGGNSFALGMNWEEDGDKRTVEEKLSDFAEAATKRTLDPEGWQRYIDGEVEKFIGIGEGLNTAKEHTKEAFVKGWTALTDGTVANFLAQPNAINDPLFRTIGGALDAMARDPNAVNHAIERLGDGIGDASEHYSTLPDRQKGQAIGEFMFFMINPEGSTEGGEIVLKLGDRAATHIDKAVFDGIRASMEATEKMAQTAPELARESRRMLQEYTKSLGLAPQELEAVGIPRGYFDDVASSQLETSENSLAMSGRASGDEPLSPSNRGPREFQEAPPRPSMHFLSEIQEAIDSLPKVERDFVREHKVKIKPVRRISDVIPGAEPNLPGVFDPSENTIYMAEEVQSLGQWRHNPDTHFAIRHEIGHAANAKLHPFGEWMSEGAEFRVAFRQDISGITPARLRDLRLEYAHIASLRDEVFADLFAHTTGLRSNNPRSQSILELFPNTLEFMKKMRQQL